MNTTVNAQFNKILENYEHHPLFNFKDIKHSKSYDFSFTEAETLQIKTYLEHQGCSEKTFFGTVFAFLIQRYANYKDILFYSKNTNKEIFPIRVNAQENKLCSTYIKELEAYFSTLMIPTNLKTEDILGEAFFELTSYFSEEEVETLLTFFSWKVIFWVVPEADNFHIKIYLDQDILEAEALKLMDYFKRIVVQVCSSEELTNAEIKLVSAAERNKLLFEYNLPIKPDSKSMVDYFKDIVAQFPDYQAVAMGDEALSYQQLDKLSDGFATNLKSKGVAAEDIVAIVAESRIEVITAMIGILKAGAAYLPIDMEYPKHRIDYILQSSKTKFVVYSEKHLKDIPANLIAISLEAEDMFVYRPEFKPTPPSKDSLAYVIYTSGTTAAPKGVMVEHKSVVRLISDKELFQLSEKDDLLQTASVLFDASTAEIWGALLNGATLHLTNKELLMNLRKLRMEILNYDITKIIFSTSFFQNVAEEEPALFEGVERIFVGGDVMPTLQSEKVLRENSGLVLVNGYGPTENTTFSTSYILPQTVSGVLPIGKPIYNSTAYIIDCFGHLQGQGLPGELYVGGGGVARGYLHDEKLTQEKFGFLEAVPEDRLYKTGDMAYMMADGNLQFIGRIDNQVKIRGFRVELGEIRNAILAFKDINSAFVSIEGEDIVNKMICAYVAGEQINLVALKEYLESLFPPYMIPSNFTVIAKFPLTANGKVDKQALTDYRLNKQKQVQTRIEPSEIEKKLLKLWKEVFQREDLSVKDDFFALGGHSLTMMSFITKAESENLAISIADIFLYPRLEQMAEKISVDFIKIAEQTEDIPLAFAQEGIWLNSKNEPIYNVVLSVTAKKKIDVEILKAAIQQITLEYQELRTVIIEDHYKPSQKIIAAAEIDVQYYQNPDQDIAEIRKRFEDEETYRIYDLTKAPLFHFKLGEGKEGRQILTIGTHHAVADAYTINIILERIDQTYQGIEAKQAIKQKENKQTFSDFALWQQQAFKNGFYQKAIEHCQKSLAKDIPLIQFPKQENSGFQEYEGKGQKIILSKEELKQFKQLCQDYKISEFTGYATIFSIFLWLIFGIENIPFGTASAGRDRSETQTIMGNFAYASLIYAKVEGQDTFASLAKKMKAEVNNILQYQTLPFEMIIEKAGLPKKYYKLPYTILIEYIKNENVEGHLGFSFAEYSNEITPAEFTFFIQAEEKEEYLHFYYRKNLFGDEEIEDFVVVMQDLFARVIQQPDEAIAKYEI